MPNKPLKYLFFALVTGVVGCHAQGIQPLVPTQGDTINQASALNAASEVAVTIRWPYRTQVIPTSAQHLSFQLKGPTTQSMEVFRPDGTSPTSVATMSVEVGDGYTLTVQAFDNAATPLLVATGTSAPFNVRSNERTNVSVALTPAYLPAITGFFPDNGGPGAAVTIVGTNFGLDRGLTPGFTFNGVPVTTVYYPQDGTVSVLVPVTALSGFILPKVDGVTGTGSGSFTVLKAIAIDPPVQSVASGSSVTFTALATTSENTAFPATPSVTWGVTAPLTSLTTINAPYRIQINGDGSPATSTESLTVGTIDQQGRFTATSTGSAQITIFSGSLMATASITVTP